MLGPCPAQQRAGTEPRSQHPGQGHRQPGGLGLMLLSTWGRAAPPDVRTRRLWGPQWCKQPHFNPDVHPSVVSMAGNPCDCTEGLCVQSGDSG